MHVCFSIVIEEQAGVKGIVVEVDGVAPLIGPDVIGLQDEVCKAMRLERGVAMRDDGAEDIVSAIFVAYGGRI